MHVQDEFGSQSSNFLIIAYDGTVKINHTLRELLQGFDQRLALLVNVGCDPEHTPPLLIDLSNKFLAFFAVSHVLQQEIVEQPHDLLVNTRVDFGPAFRRFR